jgi:hypothetical protein
MTFARGSIDDWPRLLEAVQQHRPSAAVHMGAIMGIDFLDLIPCRHSR